MESSTLRTVYDQVLLAFEEATDKAEDLASSKSNSNPRKVTTWLENATSSLISWGIDTRVNTGSLSAVVGTDVETEVRFTLLQLQVQIGRLFENDDFGSVPGPSTVNRTAATESPSNFAQNQTSADDNPLVIMSSLIGVLQDFVRPIRMLHASTSQKGPYQELKRRVDDIYQQHVERKDPDQDIPPIAGQPTMVEGTIIADPGASIGDQRQVSPKSADRKQDSFLESSTSKDLWRDLGATLRNSCEKNWEGAHFITPKTLSHIMSDETVTRLLSTETPPQQILGTVTTTIDLYACRKVLAICLYARLSPTFFYRLAHIPVSDHDLPIQEENLIYALSPSKEDIEMKSLQRFCNTQWVFSPVRLEANQPHAHFADSAILPFICDPERDIMGRGQFGEVFKIRIDPNLHGFDPAKKFAVKRYTGLLDLKSTAPNAKALSKEMSKFNHENLIRQVGTWSSNQNTYILFPSGDTNLRELLEKDHPSTLSDQVKYLDQLHKIIGAVQFVHDHNSSKAIKKQLARNRQASLAGWHLDLRPENIIVEEKENGSSQWLIADLGLSSVGTSQSRKSWYVSPELSSTLSPPGENQEDTGGQYDVWALGCIFLEILIKICDAGDPSLSRQLSSIGQLWHRSATTGRAQLKPEVLDLFKTLRQLHAVLSQFEELLNLVWATLEVDHKRRLSILELKDRLASILAQIPDSTFFNRSLKTIIDTTETEDFDESDKSSITSDDTPSGTQTPDTVYSASGHAEQQARTKWQARSMYPFLLHGLEPEPLHDDIVNTLARRVHAKPNIRSPGEYDQASPLAIQHAILRSLSYHEMKAREEDVAMAYEGTFAWIYEESGSSSLHRSFSRWSNDKNADMDIFWISGKPGSGKSTLMKYIAEKQRHDGEISKGESRPTTITHFFQLSGTVLQRSHIGFLRSLLHQILSERTDLLPNLLMDLWKTAVDCTTEFLELLPETWHNWSLSQLKRMVGDLPALLLPDEKFLLLVDGLDECDDGCLEDVISILQYLSSTENFKVCASSRPIVTILRSLDSMEGLRLQEWTYPDIYWYAKDQLSGRLESAENKIDDEDVDLIVERIVSRASGVFLWVRLVVAALVEGMRNGDSLSAISHRLDAFPDDFYNLYSMMLEKIEIQYRIETSMCLQIAVAAQSPLSLEAFDYALSEQDLNMETFPDLLTSEKTQESICRCGGFLEVRSTDSGSKIQFLHSTARDFLKQSPTWAAQERAADQRGFDVNVALLRASIFEFRSMSSSSSTTNWNEWSRAVEVAIDYAREAEKSTGQAQTALLDILDMVIEGVICTLPLSNDSLGQLCTSVHWSATLKHEFDEDFCDYCPDSFLACAVMSGLTLYVKSKRSEIATRSAKGKKPLLFYATIAARRHESNAHPSVPMVQLLFELGADPNEKLAAVPSPFDNGEATISSEISQRSPLSEVTPWDLVLRYLYLEYQGLEYDAKCEDLWLQICILFLRYDADPHIHGETYPGSEALSSDHVSNLPDTYTESSDLEPQNVALTVFREARLKRSETFQEFQDLLDYCQVS